MKASTLLCLLCLYAAACFAQSRGAAAADSLAKAAEAARSPAEKAAALCALCEARLNAKQAEAAETAARRGLALARKTADKRLLSRCAFQLAEALQRAGRLDEAAEAYIAAAGFAEQAGAARRQGEARLQTGVVYYKKGDFARSLDHYYQSLAIFRRGDDSLKILHALNNIGVAYEGRKEIKKAREYYAQCLAYAAGNPNLYPDLGRTYHNIGNTFIREGRVDSALHYYNKRLAHSEATGNTKGVVGTLSQIGSALRDKGEYKASIEFFDKALALHKTERNTFGEASVLDEIAKTKFATGAYAESRAAGRKSLALARQIGAFMIGRSVSKTLYMADSALGDMAAAFEHHKLNRQFNDSIKSESQARAIGRIEAEYAYKEELAGRERAEAEAAARREKQIWIAGGVFAALLLAAGLLFWGYRAKHNANRLLALQNAEIRQQSEEIRAQSDVIKDKNADLDAALAELRELGAFKEHLTGMVVHDLKNPLSAILGFADQPNLEDRRESLRAAALQMQGLTLDMLDVQKFESAAVKLDLTPVSAQRVLGAACAQVGFLAAEKQLALNDSAPAGLYVLADEAYLVRVLVNLLNNAVKFTPFGGKIAIAATRAESFAEFSVKDSGPGVPKDKLETIFEKYAQLDDARGANKQGTGLGLAFCKLAVEAHGGSIRAENAPKGGALFTLTIPLAESVTDARADAPLLTDRNAAPNSPPLSPEEKELVASVAAEMRRYEVHEISELTEALEPLAGATSPGVAGWRRRAENAVFELDETALAAALDEAEA